jgi:DNA-binding CsgD family transcriptional regulator/tetratricopeptide (TPR) repeat protein
MDAPARLLGRQRECAVLDALLRDLEVGRSGSLVLRGEAGIGKSALLSYAREQAANYQVASVTGVEAEAELAFGALHQLCGPFRDRFSLLPQPQRRALETAFGLTAGAPPDRFLTGLAVLTLLSEVAEDAPLVCIVDDAQWLDQISAQTLSFVARRLLAERVLMLFATRPTVAQPFVSLPHLEIEGLADRDANRLLSAVASTLFSDRIRANILSEARGNPLAILELPRGPSTIGVTRGEDPTHAERQFTSPVERNFLRRLHALTPQAQRLILVAAAEPAGDVAVLRRAADTIGLDVDTFAAEAEAADLIRVHNIVRFRHPLVRSVAYSSASIADRKEVHRILADVTNRELDPDRWAWHLASAASAPDEQVAHALVEAADRARARGGSAAAAAFLARSARLTPDPVTLGSRAIAAAQAKSEAGAYQEALDLLDLAESAPLGELDRAQADLVRGRLMFASRSASAGLPLLLAAAHRLEEVDPALAKETYRDALYAAFTAGQLPGGEGLEEVSSAIRGMSRPESPSRSDLLLDAVARVYTDGYAAAAPQMLQALSAYRRDGVTMSDLAWLPLASRMAHNFWDFETWTVLSAAMLDLARQHGAVSVLSPALLLRVGNRMYAGDFADARRLVDEAATIGDVTGSSFFAHYCALVVAPWSGREDVTRTAIEAVVSDPMLSAEGKALTATEWAAAVFYSGMGRWEEALAAARRGSAHPKEMGLSFWSAVEVVEAAAKLGRIDEAKQSARLVLELTRAAGGNWALGTAAIVTALISDEEDAAEEHYLTAIDLLGPTGVRTELARAYLLHGEWLIRARRAVDAGGSLRRAYHLFTELGALGYAERARRGLEKVGFSSVAADGGAADRRPVESLTKQESHIARLAADGLTNSEIGAQLYISAHTVDWHLRKVFAKLGIRSRSEIRTFV